MTATTEDSPFLAAARGGRPSRRPVWIMRQAGRYLPEYRELRARYSFEELVGDPELAAEVTLQPLARFDLDAAILFTDLLTPVPAMGVGLRYDPGPVLERRVRTAEQVAALRAFDPAQALRPMLETVRIVRDRLPAEKALIGFVGAPFTMAAYLVEGRGSKAWEGVRRLMHADPEVFSALLDRIAESLAPLAVALVEAGCDAIQVFDSWASVLSTGSWREFAAPRSEVLLQAARDAGAVAIHYVNGAAQHLETMAEGVADVLALDWRLPLADAVARTPSGRTLQGNLDPTALFAAPERLRALVREVCRQAGDRPHVFNLGHGILPDTDPRAVEVLIDEVRRQP